VGDSTTSEETGGERGLHTAQTRCVWKCD
jgi:hypothetical protein